MNTNDSHFGFVANHLASIRQKEGKLRKSGPKDISLLKERWFVLIGNILFYYGDYMDKVPLGFFPLDCANISKGLLEILVELDSRTVSLRCPSEQETDQWYICLKEANYETLKAKHRRRETKKVAAFELRSIFDRGFQVDALSSIHRPDPHLKLIATQLPAVKQGWAEKANPDETKYQNRFLVLTLNYLFYFKKLPMEYPAGFILMESCGLSRNNEMLFIYTCGRVYKFRMDSIESATSWLYALKDASWCDSNVEIKQS